MVLITLQSDLHHRTPNTPAPPPRTGLTACSARGCQVFLLLVGIEVGGGFCGSPLPSLKSLCYFPSDCVSATRISRRPLPPPAEAALTAPHAAWPLSPPAHPAGLRLDDPFLRTPRPAPGSTAASSRLSLLPSTGHLPTAAPARPIGPRPCPRPTGRARRVSRTARWGGRQCACARRGHRSEGEH